MTQERQEEEEGKMTQERQEELIRAKRQVVDGNFVLWQHRLTTISAAHGAVDALGLLQIPVEPIFDSNICPDAGANCSCAASLTSGSGTQLGEIVRGGDPASSPGSPAPNR